MTLQCNVVPHWLGAYTKWSLLTCQQHVPMMTTWDHTKVPVRRYQTPGLILGLHPANETALLVTTSLIGWMQAYNQPWNPIARWRAHTWMSLQTWRYFKNFCVASSWGNLKSNNEPQYRLWCAYWIRCDIHGEFRKQGDTHVQRAAQLVSQIWSCKNSFALIFILNDPIKSYTALLSWPDQNYNPIGSLFFKQ